MDWNHISSHDNASSHHDSGEIYALRCGRLTTCRIDSNGTSWSFQREDNFFRNCHPGSDKNVFKQDRDDII